MLPYSSAQSPIVASWVSLILALLVSHQPLYAQLQVKDVSPNAANITRSLGLDYQSVSGKALTVTMAADQQRVYLGGHSGVWRSDDGGATWQHKERPQPIGNAVVVNGALLCPNVYDIFVSPTNSNIVLASTGNDIRSPSKSGIYRSTDGGDNWTLVHQFSSQSVGIASRIMAAPDDPTKIYVAGQFAVAKSVDGGATWTETRPQGNQSGPVWSIVVGPQQGAQRRVYAIGNKVWYSLDDGNTWQEDAAATAASVSVGGPADGAGHSARTLAIHPGNPTIVYVASGGTIWKGNFAAVPAGAAVWTQLPPTPINYPLVTPSGTDYIAAHIDPSGKLYLFASDRRTNHICVGEPASSASWTRIDRPDVHVDPHAMTLSANFRYSEAGAGPFGRIILVCDGGAYYSTDGAKTWKLGAGVSTLGLVNATVLPGPDGIPAICIGTGDNAGFFSDNGGRSWKTQDYVGGDNDACFADPLQPNRLLVFAPRSGEKGIFLYTAPVGERPNGAIGTSQRKIIPGPPPPDGVPDGDQRKRGWNVVSNFYNLGYRPLIYAVAGQRLRPDGDFITIRFATNRSFLARTTALSSITNTNDWVTTATTENTGAAVFQQGPDLPDIAINVVQASGGHESPTFYVGQPDGSRRLWKWRTGMNQWQPLVPGPLVNGANIPAVANRFFVDPYRPNLIYVLDNAAVRRSDDGGNTWTVDASLQNALTENGAFPVSVGYDGNPGQALLRDMVFDPTQPGYRFAVGPAGVFYTADGINWLHLLLTSAMPMRPNNATYDPCERALYVSTNNCGLLRLSPLPPDFVGKIGGLLGARGRITMLRIHDVGTGYGPPKDQIDGEVVIQFNANQDNAYGFQLRNDGNKVAQKGMLTSLRQAFKTNTPVRIDYLRTGCHVGQIIRVTQQ